MLRHPAGQALADRDPERVRVRVAARRGTCPGRRSARTMPGVVVDPVDPDRVVVDEPLRLARRSPAAMPSMSWMRLSRPASSAMALRRSASVRATRRAGRCRWRRHVVAEGAGEVHLVVRPRVVRRGGTGRAGRAARRRRRSARSRSSGCPRRGRSAEARDGAFQVARRGPGRAARGSRSCRPSRVAREARDEARGSRLDSPRWAASVSGAGASSYLHSPARSTPKRLKDSSMTSSNSRSRSWRPLTSATMRRRAAARVASSAPGPPSAAPSGRGRVGARWGRAREPGGRRGS